MAAILLLPLSPVLVVTASMIVIFSKRSPLIAHLRVGQGGRPLWVLKLRTMWDQTSRGFRFTGLIEHLSAETNCPLNAKERMDPRVNSRFAALCRRFSIDEIPQLWHVFRGDMALIGPRPLTAAEIQAHYSSTYTELLRLKPGLTGLWQIKGRSALTYRQRCRLDLFLVRHWSGSLYFYILLKTIPTVFTGKNAW